VPVAGLAVAATPDGGSFAVPDSAGYADVYDSRSLTRTRRVPVSPGTQVSAAALSPDGHTMAALTTHGRLRFADLRGGLTPLQAGGYHGQVLAWSLAFSGDARWLAAAGEIDPSLRLWDARRRMVVSTSVLSPFGTAEAVTFSADSTKLAAPVNDTFGHTGIDILAVPTLALLKTLRAPPGKAVQFSPDGRLLAFGDARGRLWLYDTGTWALRGGPIAAHSGAVDTMSFSPDGKTLATTSDDGTARLWDVSSGRPIGAALPGRAGSETAAAFVAGGTRLVTLTDDGQGDSWDIQPESWARRACQVAGRTLTRAEWTDALPERSYAPACATP
jgi:WD40 repeat protein